MFLPPRRAEERKDDEPLGSRQKSGERQSSTLAPDLPDTRHDRTNRVLRDTDFPRGPGWVELVTEAILLSNCRPGVRI